MTIWILLSTFPYFFSLFPSNLCSQKCIIIMEKTLWCQFQSEALRAPVEEIIAHGCVKRKIVFTTLKAGENPQKISALTAKKKMQQLYVALLLYKIIFVDRNT
ncbi:hypothetical protein T4C_13700 [Trichinella pseudospiralis]|uniref:Uncharacterized protein n=1 Tax=Trichinella pseudospiralis TaxID=6337 RepID=A0A0V1JP01_TRIPS|nr:hypothetical protein T4C_13700 [Trichinella pseudospiralis]